MNKMPSMKAYDEKHEKWRWIGNINFEHQNFTFSEEPTVWYLLKDYDVAYFLDGRLVYGTSQAQWEE